MSDQSLTPTPEQRKMLEQLVGRELKSGEALWPIVFAALDGIGQRLAALEGGRPLRWNGPKKEPARCVCGHLVGHHLAIEGTPPDGPCAHVTCDCGRFQG